MSSVTPGTTGSTVPDEPDARVPESGELFAPVGPGVELCYQTFGDPDGDPLLLVMGLGGPMTWWPTSLCRLLAEQGFFVIRFDNRDTGRSSRLTGRVTRSMVVRAFLGRPVRAPYTLDDLAADAFGLLDHLGLPAAHVFGVSMGGMIVQTMAITAPERVRSMTTMMSTTGKRTVGWQHPALFPMLLAPRGTEREVYVEASVRGSSRIGSPGYPEPEESARRRAEETFDRGLNPAGVLRQMLAILTQPDRSARLRSLRMPVLVVHGLADKMVHVSGGRATSRSVPGSELLLVHGLGHDLPTELHETLARAVRRTADRT
ncbi:alpha/beta fold hydrolase [Nocardioides pantholopis]|uniref:alpha/beta fold hydrolase n=1 Tax=Nocardioides pantholopis TaxID=2483798 RepID=UPI000F075638|nr:alpha/beta hydrolase [Nocardioides pantholopis]